MPTYRINYITATGASDGSFTLDDDRGIESQVRRVLAELRQDGIVLFGAVDDDLSIEWNGMKLDGSLTPSQLGLTNIRPIELRMRARAIAPVVVRAKERTGEPARRFLPQSVVSASLSGALGGSVAWTILAVPRSTVAGNQDQDALALAVFLIAVGGCVLLSQLRATLRFIVALLGSVVAVGILTSVALVVVATPGVSAMSFVQQRIVLLIMAFGAASLLWAVLGPQMPSLDAALESLACGMLAGILVGLIASTDLLGLTTAVSWPLAGAAIGAAATFPRLRRAPSIFEELPLRRSPLAALSARSHAMPHDGTLRLPQGATASRRGNAVYCTASTAVDIVGVSDGDSALVNGDRVRIGSQMYLYLERARSA